MVLPVLDAVAVALEADAVAVVFDLVEPVGAGRTQTLSTWNKLRDSPM